MYSSKNSRNLHHHHQYNNDPDYINPEIVKEMWDKVIPKIGSASDKTVMIGSIGGTMSSDIGFKVIKP